MTRKICVTGGAGFIGSHLVDACLEEGWEVVAVDDFSTGYRSNLPSPGECDRLTLAEVDVRDRSRLMDLLVDVEWLFHLAAMPSVPRSVQNPVESTDRTLMGTVQLLDAARQAGVGRVVYASSSSVYGDDFTLPQDEDLAPDPRSPYAASKLSGEYFCRVFAHNYELETVALRYFNVFGPRQDPASDYAAVIPSFIQAMLSENPPVIYGDGEQSRDFTYVQDAVRANLEAARSGTSGRVYNVGNNQQTTINELYELLAEIIGPSGEPRHEDPRPGDVRHSRADASRLREDTGFASRWSLRDGLEETVAWYREHPERGR